VIRRCRVALCLIPLALAGCGDDDEQAADKPAPKKPAAAQGAGGECREVAEPRARRDGGQRKPSAELAKKKVYEVELATSCGAFTIRLDQAASPATAASFASLARRGFFDGTAFHRIVPGFVIQGGDPTGAGSGGPGYSTRDEPPADVAYTKGVVAMAKTETEPPGTAGSQFYVVTGADAGLPPEYALLGKVVKGLEVVERIGELGDPASGGAGTPRRPVVLEKATLRVRG
jgi:cyclophilin family peptidyl-prolyl cis-trans isomerase